MKLNKYYKDAYNNPSQYNLDMIKAPFTEVKIHIVKGVTDANMDRKKGTYKYKK